MQKSQWIRVFLYLAVVAVIIVLIHKYRNRHTPEERQIINFTQNIRDELPKMVDEITRLDKVIPIAGNIVNYQFTILGKKAGQINRDALKTAMTPYLTEDYQNDPALQGLRKIGTTIVYTYFDEDGILVCEIKITPKKSTNSPVPSS